MAPTHEDFHELHGVVLSHGATISTLDRTVTEIEERLNQVAEQVMKNGERQKYFAASLDALQGNFNNMDRQMTLMAADHLSLRRDASETRDIANQIRQMVQNGHDLLNAHIGQETMQFSEYAQSAARSTAAVEKLSRYLVWILSAMVVVIVLLSAVLNKYGVAEKILGALG